jgi:hypothetical protein
MFVAMCKQLTYTDEELAKESSLELSRTLAVIHELRGELIGDFWPRMLDYTRQAITNEFARREENIL